MDISKSKSPIIKAGRRDFIAALVLCVLLLAVISCRGRNNEVRHVLPGNSPLSGSLSLDRVLPSSHRIQGFPHIFMGYTGKGGYPAQHFYGRCYMGAFLMVMQYYGFRDQGLVEGLMGDAFGFQYYSGVRPRIFVMGGPEGYPAGSRNDIFTKVPGWLGCRVTLPQVKEGSRAWELLKSALIANHPVIVYVDERPLLPSLSAISPMRKLQLEELRRNGDENGNWGHHMVAVGYDSSSVTLFDPGDRAESGSYQKVPITDFIRAWVGSGPCAYHHYSAFTQIVIVPGAQTPPLGEVVSRSLLNDLKLLRGLGPQKVPGRRAEEPDSVRYCGLVGLRRLSGDIAARPEMIRDIGQEGWMFFFGIQGSMAREAAARSLLSFARFSVKGRKNLEEASRYLFFSSKIFREVHTTCLQPGGIGRVSPEYLCGRLKAIAAVEGKAADHMEQALSALAVPSKR
ncbi:MAG: hypothetical protein V2A78_09800 [bacterium]